jgi:hypothetical protein
MQPARDYQGHAGRHRNSRNCLHCFLHARLVTRQILNPSCVCRAKSEGGRPKTKALSEAKNPNLRDRPTTSMRAALVSS